MRPKLSFLRIAGAIQHSSRANTIIIPSRHVKLSLCRCFAANSKDLPTAPPNESGLNESTLPHVSEEARDIGETMGTGGPEIEQGTKVDEVRGKALMSLAG
jgi:hypothetical protein